MGRTAEINLGVVGSGLIWASVHEPIVSRRSEIRIAAFCARSRESLARVSARYPGVSTHHSGSLDECRNYFNLRGTEGLTSFEDGAATIRSDRGIQERIDGSTTQHENAWAAAIDYILHGREPVYPLTDARRDLTIIDAVSRSIASGRPQALR